MKVISSARPITHGILDESETISSLVDDYKYFMTATKDNITKVINWFFVTATEVDGRFFNLISTGEPLTIFESDYCPPEGVNVHCAVASAMDHYWLPTTAEKAKNLVESKLNINYPQDKLTKDEALALLYYTIDGPTTLAEKYSVFNCLSLSLQTRGVDKEQTDNWKHYLYLLLHGANKLPVHETCVYRGIPVTLSEIYKINNQVTWITVTSTSEDIMAAKRFAKTKGTLMRIRVTTGRSIAKYSVYPKEKEVLLLPNCEFVVSKRNDAENEVDLLQISQPDEKLSLMTK